MNICQNRWEHYFEHMETLEGLCSFKCSKCDLEFTHQVTERRGS